MSRKGRPPLVSGVAVVYMIIGAFGLARFLSLLFYASTEDIRTGLFFGVGGVLAFSGAVGLWKKRPWARTLLEVMGWCFLATAIGHVAWSLAVPFRSSSGLALAADIFLLSYGSFSAIILRNRKTHEWADRRRRPRDPERD